MPIFEKWYRGKKPTLQIEIVKSIALEGESSKIKLQALLNAHYPDISDAIELLKERKIIEWSRDDYKSRRAEHYYKLTRRGLEVIIDEFSDPEIFWKAVISYCKLCKHPMSSEEFNKSYKAFEAKYIGYSQAYGFFFQSDFVDKLFNEWLTIRKNGGGITIFQKVLECIALHPSITLEQIIGYLQTQKTKYEDAILKQHRKKVRNQKAQFSEFITEFERKRYQENDVLEGNIMNVIDRYTLSSNYSFEQFSEISEPMEINAQYSEFISHLLIRVIENRTGKRYELTLFGVVLILAIVHYDHLNPSKIFFNEFLDQQRNNNYYNRVISNYKDKIPLIFAKWQILTDVFNGVDYLMANFEPVFYKEIRTPLISLPMNMGGVKEIYENTRGIAYHGYSKLTEIHKSGVSVLETSTEVDPSYYMSFIKDKLSNIELLLQTTDLQRFMGYIAKQNYSSIYQTGIVTAIENSFANEVSFLFYITLTTKANFLPQFRDEHIMPSRLYEFMMRGTEESNVVKPRDLLLEILERDIEIQDRFLLWMKDLISYERQIIDNMLNLQNEVGLH